MERVKLIIQTEKVGKSERMREGSNTGLVKGS